MNLLTSHLFPYLLKVVKREEGQDLVEYALVVALIAFGSVAGMGYLANGINNAFSAIATILTADI